MSGRASVCHLDASLPCTRGLPFEQVSIYAVFLPGGDLGEGNAQTGTGGLVASRLGGHTRTGGASATGPLRAKRKLGSVLEGVLIGVKRE